MATYKATLAAIADKRNESDSWVLADALLKEVGPGMDRAPFKQIAKLAEQQGLGTTSANTLRVYRDTAANWPETQRVQGVSFSAHRAANGAPATQRETLLRTLAATHGAAKVSVKRVHDELVAQGHSQRKTNTTAGAQAAQQPTAADVQAAVDMALDSQSTIALAHRLRARIESNVMDVSAEVLGDKYGDKAIAALGELVTHANTARGIVSTEVDDALGKQTAMDLVGRLTTELQPSAVGKVPVQRASAFVAALLAHGGGERIAAMLADLAAAYRKESGVVNVNARRYGGAKPKTTAKTDTKTDTKPAAKPAAGRGNVRNLRKPA